MAPLWVNVDVEREGRLPAEELLEVVRGGLGEHYEVYDPGRWQVPDVMVKRSDAVGVAIQILRRRHHGRIRLRCAVMAPKVVLRGATPISRTMEVQQGSGLLDEVVAFLREDARLGDAGS